MQRKYVLVVNIQFFNIWEKRYLCILYLLGDIHFSAYLNFTALAKKVSFPLEVLEILMIFIIATPYNLHPSVYQLYFIVHSRARCDHTCKINQDKSGLPGFEPAPCWLVDDSGFQVFSWGSSAADIIHSVPMLWAECWTGILRFRNFGPKLSNSMANIPLDYA